MKAIEIFEGKEEMMVIKSLDPRVVLNPKTSKEAVECLKGPFFDFLDDLAQYLEAWIDLAKEHKYPWVHADASLRAINSITDKIDSQLREGLSVQSLNLIVKKLDLYIKHFGDFTAKIRDIDGMSKTAGKLSKLYKVLEGALEEAKNAEGNSGNKKVTAKELGSMAS